LTNLLQETLEVIKEVGRLPEQVVFVGSYGGEYGMSWDDFVKIADVEYDSGFGAAEVATDLIVQFDDASYMMRGEYDGSEWWEYPKPFPLFQVEDAKPITRVVGGYWVPVAEMNGGNK
jgi:hypothetical protein